VPEETSLKTPNKWPATSILAEEEFKAPLMIYHQKMFELALTVVEILAAGMPYGPRIFDDFVAGNIVAPLRLLHYPPQKTQDTRQLGVGAHTDFGAITLLLQDETPGLQVFNEASKTWIQVPPNKDAYVVNIGDMLSRWTKGVYKSGLHRVLNRSTRDRYSVPYFFDGNMNCILKPLDGDPNGPIITVKEHLAARRDEVYGRGNNQGALTLATA
jgi:isopenicillin N synthase-like dioxygenase